ncbi:tetratricopeptide repeat protein [Marinifilum sp. RC60d5]|uniref:tetratricopeptide repeat protein n=1 Tax=Marinifilum sp. RC60d5 TaxID=3458414 RepID=UPI004037005D
MKTRLLIVTAVLLFSSLFTVKAQTLESKYGLDSAQTVLNASLYVEMVKQKNYEEALPGWRYVFNNAPAFQKTTYIKGVSIMRGMLAKTRNPKYVDSLMMVYDKRIKYFGKDRKYPSGWILGRKGGDLFKYKKKHIPSVKEAYSILKKSIEMQGLKSEATVINYTMEASGILVKAGEIEAEEVIDNYLLFMDMAEKQKAAQTNEKKKENIENARLNVERIFFTAGVADCETLSNIFTPKFEANKDDMVLINKILRMLNRQECEDGALYAMVAERKYELEPNADAAHNLAKMFIKKKEFAKSKGYLEQAIKLEKDADTQADLHYKLAYILLSQNQLSASKSNALQAAKLRSGWGQPYLLIGKAYAAYSKKYGTSALDHQKVYWVAVDKFLKAKAIDPECAEEARGLINTYSKYFPGTEEAFFEGIKNGDIVKIGDWINETTKARLNE